MSIAALKQKSASSLSKLRDAIQQNSGKGGNFAADTTYWRPTLDAEKGTGIAVLRFMPEPEGEDFAFVKYFEHSFSGKTGKKYFEKSRTSIGEKDPVGELNSRLWNSGVESDKDVARAQKRKKKYVSNIYVIDDPAHPENNGKVFKFAYGEKIFALLQSKICPEFEGEQPSNPFDLDTGSNVILRIRILKTGEQSFWNYDKSTVEPASKFLDGDEKKQGEVYAKLHSLKALLDPTLFKPYDKLQARMLEVLGPVVGSGIPTIVGDAAPSNMPPVQRVAPTVTPTVKVEEAQAASASSDAESDGGDDEAYFRKLMTA